MNLFRNPIYFYGFALLMGSCCLNFTGCSAFKSARVEDSKEKCYVDFVFQAQDPLSWDIVELNATGKPIKTLHRNIKPSLDPIPRIPVKAGSHEFQINVLNKIVRQSGRVRFEAQKGHVIPIEITLKDAGDVAVETKSTQVRGNYKGCYGRTSKFGTEHVQSLDISAIAQQSKPFH